MQKNHKVSKHNNVGDEQAVTRDRFAALSAGGVVGAASDGSSGDVSLLSGANKSHTLTSHSSHT